MNLVRLIEESAKKFSWHRYMISAKGSINFRTLNRKANQLSFGLKERLRIQKGDRVAILLNNCPEFIIALFAILKAEAVCVPLNVFLTFTELKYILKDSRVKLLISSSEFSEILHKILEEKQKEIKDLLNLENIVLTDKKADKFLYGIGKYKNIRYHCENRIRVIAKRFSCWNQIIVKDQIEDPSHEVNPQDLALLIYTSGTTGFPKGVMLSHSNLASNVISSVSALKITSRDRFLLILPMFHSFTLTVCILIPLYVGARIVIIKSVRPFQKVLRSIFLNRVTIIVGIPPLFDILKNLSLPAILQVFLRVKVCISGAAPLSVETLKTFKKRFSKITLLEGYGLTEASPVVSFNPLQGIQKPGSIGLPLPGVEVKVVREDESEAACGEIGELILKGPNVMMGYLNRPQETKEAIRGDWLFTGDMVKIDSDGYIYIVGRKKEMILTHGMNVYPLEIENVLNVHPKIKEAAVVGKKDKSKGEIPVAFIVLKEGVKALEGSEIINYCKDKLANYKIPRLIEFREDLPKTPTGKVLKRKLFESSS